MIFTKTTNKLTGHLYVKSDEIEITVADDGVYIAGVGGGDDDNKAGKLTTYEDIQHFAKALGDAWLEYERRQRLKKIEVLKSVPPGETI